MLENVTVTYKDDGVYLTVYASEKDREILDEDMVTMKLNRKKIKNWNMQQVRLCIKGQYNIPVKIAEAQAEEMIDEEVLISLTPDHMEALMTLLAPDGGKRMDFSDLMREIHNKGIINGIDQKMIQYCLEHKEYDEKIVFAKGSPPIHGSPAQLKYHIKQTPNLKPRILDDGRVDHKNLDLIQNVHKGDILVTLIPATEGVPGHTVTGRSIKPKPGRNIKLPKGKNVYVSEDGTKLIAAIDGKVEIHDGKVHVFSLLEIENDVDNSTGNIDFVGNVVVRGNVLTGFEINAVGNIEVFGIVEGATMQAGGDIILHKGIQGMERGVLKAEGNLISRFVENASVYVEGNIFSGAIMHSQVECGGKVIVSGKKGLLVGGRMRAGQEITANIIGSIMATNTDLEVGIHPQLRFRLDELRKQLERYNTEAKKASQILELLSKLERNGQLSLEKAGTKLKVLQTKIKLSHQVSQTELEIHVIEEKLSTISNGAIHVKKVIFPGVTITIGNSFLHIKDPLGANTFRRDKGDILFSIYSGE